MFNSKKIATGKQEMLKTINDMNRGRDDNIKQRNEIFRYFKNAQEIGDSVFLYIPVEYMKVDIENYQRPVYSHVHKIAKEWDDKKCDPLIVNYREDGFFYIIDGQHRYEAAVHRKIDCLVCRCFVGLSVAEESKIFSDVNILSKKLIPYETFKSNLCHGEKIDTEIQKICDKYGVKIDGSQELKTLRCVTLCRRLLKREILSESKSYGNLERVICTISKSNWHLTQTMAYSYKVVNSLYILSIENLDMLDYIQEKLCDAFKAISYIDVCAFANLEYPRLSPYAGFTMVLRNIVNGKISVSEDIKNRIYNTDDNQIIC